MQVNQAFTRLVAALLITVLLNGALVVAFDNVAAHEGPGRAATHLLG